MRTTLTSCLLVVDWVQTLSVTDMGMETNPIIGKHGEVVPPTLYFIVCLLSLVWCAVVMPERVARVIVSSVLLLEIYVITLNVMNGFTPTWGA